MFTNEVKETGALLSFFRDWRVETGYITSSAANPDFTTLGSRADGTFAMQGAATSKAESIGAFPSAMNDCVSPARRHHREIAKGNANRQWWPHYQDKAAVSPEHFPISGSLVLFLVVRVLHFFPS